VFLGSHAAVSITGVTLVSDAGCSSAGMSGSFAPASGAVESMRSVF
jgi:hypothetical protein